jgi:hypothetical protein
MTTRRKWLTILTAALPMAVVGAWLGRPPKAQADPPRDSRDKCTPCDDGCCNRNEPACCQA